VFDDSVSTLSLTHNDFDEDPPSTSLTTSSSLVPTTTLKCGLSDIEMGSTIDSHKNMDVTTSTVSNLLKNVVKHVQRVHEKLGHVDLKFIFKFKFHGKVVCANLSSKFLKVYRQV
jgi:hypothetical protein